MTWASGMMGWDMVVLGEVLAYFAGGKDVKHCGLKMCCEDCIFQHWLQQYLSSCNVILTFLPLWRGLCSTIFWSWCTACGILVTWSGIQLMPPAWGAQSPSYWTCREVPRSLSLNLGRLMTTEEMRLDHTWWYSVLPCSLGILFLKPRHFAMKPKKPHGSQDSFFSQVTQLRSQPTASISCKTCEWIFRRFWLFESSLLRVQTLLHGDESSLLLNSWILIEYEGIIRWFYLVFALSLSYHSESNVNINWSFHLTREH